MSSCQYRRGACILATRHGSHMLQGERGPQGGDNLQPACSSSSSNTHMQINTHMHSSLLHTGMQERERERESTPELVLTRYLHMYMLNTRHMRAHVGARLPLLCKIIHSCTGAQTHMSPTEAHGLYTQKHMQGFMHAYCIHSSHWEDRRRLSLKTHISLECAY